MWKLGYALFGTALSRTRIDNCVAKAEQDLEIIQIDGEEAKPDELSQNTQKITAEGVCSGYLHEGLHVVTLHVTHHIHQALREIWSTT